MILGAPRQRRTATKESRVKEFSRSVSFANPQHGADFARLTLAGQKMYVSLRDDDYDHEAAMRDSRYSHGEQR